MLHLISIPVLQQEIVDRIAAGDDVVLQQGAVWAAFNGHADNLKLLHLFSRQASVYVLQEMLTVNGIEPSQLIIGVNVIDYAGLVELSVKNPVIHTWC